MHRLTTQIEIESVNLPEWDQTRTLTIPYTPFAGTYEVSTTDATYKINGYSKTKMPFDALTPIQVLGVLQHDSELRKEGWKPISYTALMYLLRHPTDRVLYDSFKGKSIVTGSAIEQYQNIGLLGTASVTKVDGRFILGGLDNPIDQVGYPYGEVNQMVKLNKISKSTQAIPLPNEETERIRRHTVIQTGEGNRLIGIFLGEDGGSLMVWADLRPDQKYHATARLWRKVE